MRIFISSTGRDLAAHRLAVYNAVRSLGLDANAMEHWGARSEDAVTASLDEVDGSTLLISLIGWRYGHRPHDAPYDGLTSITELEYRHARALDKTVLIYLGDEMLRAHTPAEVLDEGPLLPASGERPAEAALTRFRERLESAHVRAHFSHDTAGLAYLVRQDLMRELHIHDPRSFFVPGDPSDAFVGREDALHQLDELLGAGHIAPSGGVAHRRVAVVGMGGVGKTELVTNYVHRYHERWSGGVFWLPGQSDNGASLVSHLTSYARQLDLATPGDTEDALVEKFAAHVRRQQGVTLLVVDDADWPEALVEADIAPGVRLGALGCRLLFTTRRGVLPSTFVTLPLYQLDSDAALALLLHGYPGILTAAHQDAERQAAQAICARLGYHPLALRIAGAHLERYAGEVMPSGFLQFLNEEGLEALEKVTEDPAKGVRAVLRLSWKRMGLNDESEAAWARHVLRVMACFPVGTVVPRRRLALACGPEPTPRRAGRPSLLRSALDRVVKECLVEQKDDQYWLHPLVHEFVAQDASVESDATQRSAFAEEVAATYARALCVPEQLDALLSSGGIVAAQGDFQAAAEMMAALPAPTSVPTRSPRSTRRGPAQTGLAQAASWQDALANWHRCLEREAHTIARMADELPGQQIAAVFAWQQLRNRALELGVEEVRRTAEDQLGAKAAPWLSLRRPAGGEDPSLLRTLERHGGEVSTLAWSPDGRILASGSRDATIRLWSARQMAQLAELTGHTGAVRAVAWSPDGRTLASGGLDGIVYLWTGVFGDGGTLSRTTAHKEPTGHAGGVNALAWSPDGRTLASAGRDGTLRLWSVGAVGEDEAVVLAAHDGSVRAVVWSPDGARLASGGHDGTVRMWQRTAGSRLHFTPGVNWAAHTGGVHALAWAPDRPILASGGEDGLARLWNTEHIAHDEAQDDDSVPEGAALSGHRGAVRTVSWSLDGRTLATGADDGAVRLWRLTATSSGPGMCQAILAGHAGPVAAVVWNRDGRTLTSGGSDKTIRLWDVERAVQGDRRHVDGSQAPDSSEGHEGLVRTVSWAADGQMLATGGDDRTVQLWAGDSGTHVATLAGQTHRVWALAWSPDGRMLASGGGPNDATVRVWEIGDVHARIPRAGPRRAPAQAQRTTLGNHAESVATVAWSPDGRIVASGGADRCVYLWDAGDRSGRRRELSCLAGHTREVMALAWSPDGRALASGGRDRAVRLWKVDSAAGDMADDRKAQVLPGQAGDVYVLAWSPRAQRLASGRRDGTLHLWRVPEDLSGHIASEAVWTAHAGGVVAAAWHPGGYLLASSGRDRMVRVWEANTGSLLAAFPTGGIALALHWSADGRGLRACDLVGAPARPRIYDLALLGYDPLPS